MYDTLIVGGGIAGMSAALILGRCRRKVAVFDSGKPRNEYTQYTNGYLSRDGINPHEFSSLAREELLRYGTDWFDTVIVAAGKNKADFWVENAAKEKWHGRKMLIATGLVDNFPPVSGFKECYGISIHHCPICDGWESRNKKIIVYGKRKSAFATALEMINWSADITLCTDGASSFTSREREILAAKHIEIINDKIASFENKDGHIQQVTFYHRDSQPCERLFFSLGYTQRSDLAYKMGCKTQKKGREFWVNRHQMSSIEGLFISGDACFDMKMAIVAAADGAKAGVAINLALMEEKD